MLFGVALVITWLILLIRYPTKALPVSMAVLVGLGLVATWVILRATLTGSVLLRLQALFLSPGLPPGLAARTRKRRPQPTAPQMPLTKPRKRLPSE